MVNNTYLVRTVSFNGSENFTNFPRVAPYVWSQTCARKRRNYWLSLVISNLKPKKKGKWLKFSENKKLRKNICTSEEVAIDWTNLHNEKLQRIWFWWSNQRGWYLREQKQWVWNVCWETWRAKTIFGRPSYRWEDDLTSHKTSAAEYNNNETFGVIVPRYKIREYNTITPSTFNICYGICVYFGYGLTIDHRDIVGVKSYNRYLLNIEIVDMQYLIHQFSKSIIIISHLWWPSYMVQPIHRHHRGGCIQRNINTANSVVCICISLYTASLTVAL
jgi:hypothetical protein